jgi:carbonic anhydrase
MTQANLTAREALDRLIDGNLRYAQNVRSVDSLLSHSHRDLTIQRPHTIVLGCSDSRAPAEVVFDQGLGDLFVIRVAGNIVSRGLLSIVDRVRPSIESLIATDLAGDPERLRREAIRANVRASVNQLRHSSQTLERLADGGELAVVGAELDVATGAVAFFTGLPA